MKTNPAQWMVEAVWRTSAAHIRDVLATRWPTPPDVFVQLIAQPGSADLRTRVEVRPVNGRLASDVAVQWLEGLAERLLVLGSAPRLVSGS